MKSYNLTPQERDSYCICSVLQVIFKKYGINISQGDIAGNLSPSEKGFLVDDKKIKKFLQSKGFGYEHYWHNQTPFNETDMVLADMCDNHGVIGINSHVYLLRNFSDPQLEMINPADGKTINKDIYQLLREMERSEGFFGLIRRLE